MKQEFKLPELGEDVETGDVLKVLVSKGDRLEAEQPVIEIETDKATLEVPVDAAGTVASIEVSEGDTIEVGQLILTLETDGAGKAEEAEEAKEAKETKEGKREERPEEPARPEEPKAAEVEREETEAEPERAPEGEAEIRRRAPGKKVPAAPSVRRLAREIGVDVTALRGTGPGGRLSIEDVKAHARGALTAGAAGSPSPATLPDFEKWGSVRRKPMSSLRRTVARRLSRAWTEIPHVTQHDGADITELEKLRKEYAPRVEALGGKLTLTAIAIRIAATALGRFPQLNASIDLMNEEIVEKEYRHIGVAVDTERGLVVPVVRNADAMSISEIAVSLTEIAERARAGKLDRSEMEGGSFTVTNLGGIGGTSFTPIVNWPEVAILGMSRGRREPMWRDGSFEPRLVLPLSLSYDHRLIDGADAARFLRWVAEAFEQPFLLSL